MPTAWPRMVLLLSFLLAAPGVSRAQPGNGAPSSAAAAPAAPAARDEAFEAAVFLLRHAQRPQRDGSHHVLLRSLRHLADPELKPYFGALMESDNPTLKIHGFLGLGECDREKRLDLVRLATIKEPRLQAEMLTAALDNDMLDVTQAKQVVAWAEIDPAVKIMVATLLVKEKQFADLELLRKRLQAEKAGQRGIAAMLLTQLGDPAGLEGLRALDTSTDPTRDDVRELVLQTALRFELDQLAPWAMEVASSPRTSPRLMLVALRIALRFQHPGAAAFWRQRFGTTTDLAQRTRMALLALNLAPWMPDVTLYEPLLSGDDPLLKAIGGAGAAVARKQGVAPAVAALIGQQHGIANVWALGYAKRHATVEDAGQILLSFIQSYQSAQRNQVQRLDDAVTAAGVLTERDPQLAARLLQPLLRDPKTSPALVQAILLGLLRCKGAAAHQVVQGLPPIENADTATLVLLLEAKAAPRLSAPQLRELGTVVRGGGDLPDSLRLQAGWIYLQRTGQTQAALSRVMGG